VAILSRGRAVAAGPVDEVLSAGRVAGLVAKVDDLPAGLSALLDAGIRAEATDGLLRVELPPQEGARVTRTLADRGLYLTELRPDAVDLETVFLELTAPLNEAGNMQSSEPAPPQGSETS
jgi:ABC-2 type transport system ATP-binding protein